MKKGYFRIILTVLLLSAFRCLDAVADPANPNPFQYTQPDGSVITLILHGDEYFSWTTDTDGRILERGSDGFYRYTGGTSSSIRRMAASQAKARRDAMRVQSPIRKIAPNGRKRFLIMLVEFRDKKFTTESPNEAFYNLANQTGYSVNGSIGCITDYFYQNSYGAFQPVFDVVGPITLDKSATDFPEGDHPNHYGFASESFLEAMRLADPDVDYSQYDLDGNGYIDTVYFIYPGEAQSNGGGPDTIWPHASGIYGTVFDGVGTGSYACSSELVRRYSNRPPQMCGIGTICHEFGHVIGLPDTYDTDYAENGSALHPNSYSLMAGGNHNNGGYVPSNITAFEKSLLGWMDIPMLEEGTISLPDLGTHPAAGYIPTDNDGEWYVFETRDGQGWDKGLPPGLVVFHLDRSETMVGNRTARQRWDSWDGINAYQIHPCFTPLLASGPFEDGYEESIPFPGWKDVTEYTFMGWSGNRTGYRMKNISFQNSTATFDLDFYYKKITGTVRDKQGNPLAGVRVSVAPVQKNPAYIKGRKLSPKPARNIADRASASFVSRADGSYELAFEDQGDSYDIYAEKDNFIPYSQVVSFDGSKMLSLDLELILFIHGGDATLQKHNGKWGRTYGYGTNQIGLSASVRFNADELTDYVGKVLESVDLFIAGSSAEKLYIIVDAGEERVVFHPIDLSTFRWEEWSRVDLSEEHYVIPEGKELHIGYGLVNPEYGYPWATDSGPKVDGGFCYFTDVKETTHAWWENIDSNLLLGVNLTSPSTIDESITLLDLGINYISPLPDGIRKGDTIKLSIVKSPSNSPTGVKWFCDGVECSASPKAQIGTHTIKAVLSFKNGHTEILETQYRAE